MKKLIIYLKLTPIVIGTIIMGIIGIISYYSLYLWDKLANLLTK